MATGSGLAAQTNHTLKVRKDYTLKGADQPLDVHTHSYFGVLSQLYGDSVHEIVCMPNLNNPNKHKSPSGFVMALNPGAPMFPDPFESNKLMSWGSAIAELRAPNGLKLTDQFFQDPARGFKEKLAASVSSNPSAEGINIGTRDPDTNLDKPNSAWKGAIGGSPSSYVGIYRMSTTDGSKREEKYVVATTCGAPELSRHLHRGIEDAHFEAGKTRMSVDSFLQNAETMYTKNAGKRNRSKVLWSAANAVGCSVPSKIDMASPYRENLAIASVETPSYMIEKHDNRSLYYAGATCTLRCNGGIILGQTPRMGPILLHGSPTAAVRGGGAWAHPDSYHGFPIGTGKQVSDNHFISSAEFSTPEKIHGGLMPSSSPFVWHGETAAHTRLYPDFYRGRNLEFTVAEERLGRQRAWTSSELVPVLVLMANPVKLSV